jgi:hypothetical protein
MQIPGGLEVTSERTTVEHRGEMLEHGAPCVPMRRMMDRA